MIINADNKEMIYLEYREKVFGYILKRVNDFNLAEDICADVFLKIYEKLDSFNEEKASLSTWIYTVTANTLTDYYRTRHISEEIPETLRDSTSVEDEICNAEMLDRLADALEKLPQKERDVILLYYYSEVTMKDISERMGISYSYVKLIHKKALEDLKKYL